MNLCGYFLWDYLKFRVYRTNPHTVQELQAEIEAASEEITGDMLCDTVDNLWFVYSESKNRRIPH
jgi:RNase P/RNase MRP subunit POP5